METSNDLAGQIEQYEAAFRALVNGAVAHGPARPEELDETTEYEGPELNGLVNTYISRSDSLAEVLLGSNDNDTYTAAAAIRRTLALVGGDFLAAQMVAGLAADQALIIGVLEEEFAGPSGSGSPIELLGQAVLTDGLPTVIAGLRGGEQIGAAGVPVTKAALVDTADTVVEDVFAQGADLASKAFHAAIPTPQLIGWGSSLVESFTLILDPLPAVRGWLAKTARRLLEAAREKITRIFDRFVANSSGVPVQALADHAHRLLSHLVDFSTDRLIARGLRSFYNLDGLRMRCQQKIDPLNQNQRTIAFERLQEIPGHTKSWLQWGRYGASALSLAAPLLHGAGAIPVPIAVGSLIVFYALWVTHDHLDWPSWWRSLLKSRGVLAVL